MAQQIASGTNSIRGFTIVNRATGDPVDSGTVNYYLKALSGAQVGKWWDNTSTTWEVSATGNAMTHQGDGHWSIDLESAALVNGDTLLEYGIESGDLHIPVGQVLNVVDPDAVSTEETIRRVCPS